MASTKIDVVAASPEAKAEVGDMVRSINGSVSAGTQRLIDALLPIEQHARKTSQLLREYGGQLLSELRRYIASDSAGRLSGSSDVHLVMMWLEGLVNELPSKQPEPQIHIYDLPDDQKPSTTTVERDENGIRVTIGKDATRKPDAPQRKTYRKDGKRFVLLDGVRDESRLACLNLRRRTEQPSETLDKDELDRVERHAKSASEALRKYGRELLAEFNGETAKTFAGQKDGRDGNAV